MRKPGLQKAMSSVKTTLPSCGTWIEKLWQGRLDALSRRPDIALPHFQNLIGVIQNPAFGSKHGKYLC